MSGQKTAKELMIPLEDYPHIPYWYTLRQAMAIVREAAVKFEGAFEPRAVLVFDEKYQLMGILTLRDIITGLEPRFLQKTHLVKMDPSLTVLLGESCGPKLREQSQRPVSEVMTSIKVTVDVGDPIAKPLYVMIKENIGLIPVMESGKVVGILRLSDLFGEISALVLGDQA
jgi:CBS domain-containing protein